MTITVNGAELTTDNLADAQRAIADAHKAEAKERRERAKEAKRRKEAAELAIAQAERIGFWIYRTKAEDGRFPASFELLRERDNYSPVKVEREYRSLILDIEAHGGRATWEGSPGAKFVGCVGDAAGYARLVFLLDSYTGTTIAYAVGVHDGLAVLTPMPGITPDDFERSV